MKNIFPLTLLGPNSHRDDFAIAFNVNIAKERIKDFFDHTISDGKIAERYDLVDNRDWQLTKARIRPSKLPSAVDCIYRPFDNRQMLYGTYAFDYPRPEINDQLVDLENLALISTKQTKENFAAFVSCLPVGQHKLVTPYDGSYVSPLYIYPREKRDLLDNASTEKRANFSPEFLQNVKSKLGKVSPEALFAYIYAVLYSLAYRARYAEFLKRDFPRVPITADRKRFDALAALGQTLIDLHIMRVHAKAVCTYPVPGNNRVDKVEYRQDAESSTAPDNSRLHINKEQYFADVPEAVWNYHIGGYQVAHKWLKDRKGRLLTFDDLQHYQHVLAALAETIRLQKEIDKVIPAWPMT